jgi:hypothetical protein
MRTKADSAVPLALVVNRMAVSFLTCVSRTPPSLGPQGSQDTLAPPYRSMAAVLPIAIKHHNCHVPRAGGDGIRGGRKTVNIQHIQQT